MVDKTLCAMIDYCEARGLRYFSHEGRFAMLADGKDELHAVLALIAECVIHGGFDVTKVTNTKVGSENIAVWPNIEYLQKETV